MILDTRSRGTAAVVCFAAKRLGFAPTGLSFEFWKCNKNVRRRQTDVCLRVGGPIRQSAGPPGQAQDVWSIRVTVRSLAVRRSVPVGPLRPTHDPRHWSRAECQCHGCHCPHTRGFHESLSLGLGELECHHDTQGLDRMHWHVVVSLTGSYHDGTRLRLSRPAPQPPPPPGEHRSRAGGAWQRTVAPSIDDHRPGEPGPGSGPGGSRAKYYFRGGAGIRA